MCPCNHKPCTCCSCDDKTSHVQKMKEARIAGKIIECARKEGEWVTYRGGMWLECNTYRIKPEPAPVPHKHAALIKAWADGAEIEFRSKSDEQWRLIINPNWHDYREYRIKPTPKPDKVRYARASAGDGEHVSYDASCTKTYWSVKKGGSDNIMAIFDGETGLLKSVSLL